MKLWELVSACRTEPELLQRLSANPAWSRYLAAVNDFDRLVDAQDRSTLDAEVPDDACLQVLSGSRAVYFLADGFVRTTKRSPDDQQLSAAEVFSRYGGSFLEDVNESGLAAVPG